MKIIFCKHIPFEGYVAFNFFGLLIVREEYRSWFGDKATAYQKKKVNILINHESIHTAQMKETLYVGFYILYLLAWIFRIITPPWKSAYRDVSFEQEAYYFEKDLNYLSIRKPYKWVNYIFTSYNESNRSL